MTTGSPDPHPAPRRTPTPQPLARPFPAPGPKVRLAYRELHLAENGTPEQRRATGNPALLAHPWDPGTCTDPVLRLQLWQWLEAVVIWLNHEYTWDLAAMVPTCWPRHPHMVHEIAVLADQRRRASLATTSQVLEEWHRYALPTFTDRMRGRLRSHCDEGHQPWPGRSRHNQQTSTAETENRENLYARDIDALSRQSPTGGDVQRTTPLGVVDLEIGQIECGVHPDDP